MNKPLSTSDAILNSATQLLAVSGYHGFSYADIAEEVGIRKASIHHYFPNKSDLVAAVVQNYVNAVRSGLAAIETSVPEPAAQLKTYINYWRTCIAEATKPYCVCVMLAGEITTLPPSVADAVREHFNVLTKWLETTLAAAAKTNKASLLLSPKAEAEAFVATIHGAMLSARATNNPAIFSQIADHLITRLHL